MCATTEKQLDFNLAREQRRLLLKGDCRRRNEHLAHQCGHARVLPPVGECLLPMRNQIVSHPFVRNDWIICEHLVPIDMVAMGMRIKEVQHSILLPFLSISTQRHCFGHSNPRINHEHASTLSNLSAITTAPENGVYPRYNLLNG